MRRILTAFVVLAIVIAFAIWYAGASDPVIEELERIELTVEAGEK